MISCKKAIFRLGSLNNLIDNIKEKFPPEYEQVKHEMGRHEMSRASNILRFQKKILHLAKALHCCQNLQFSAALGFLSNNIVSNVAIKSIKFSTFFISPLHCKYNSKNAYIYSRGGQLL